jgi:hypothetical protein
LPSHSYLEAQIFIFAGSNLPPASSLSLFREIFVMAILSAFPGLSVEVVMAGTSCLEYPDTDNDNGDSDEKVTRYIEAKSNAEYGVQIDIPRGLMDGKYDIRSKIYIDGYKVGGTVLRRVKYIQQGYRRVHSAQCVGSGDNWKKRAFCFSDLIKGRIPNMRFSV